MMMNDIVKFRMSAYEEHKLDCAGHCQPIDWPSFKKIWVENRGEWSASICAATSLATKRHEECV